MKNVANPLLILVVLACASPLSGQEIPVPQLADPDLELSLVLCEPEIVTPTALASDLKGRLYIAETNTHARNSAYKGRADDRILVMEDRDGDGELEKPRTLVDGLKNVLAIAVSDTGDLYVLQMKKLLVFRDRDDDGRPEIRDELFSIETSNNNHHGVFLALALDSRNRPHVSLGNIGGASYRIRAADGSQIEGQGDTGLIVRLNAKGGSIVRFAGGFWNPCDMKFDAYGRLIATDNDPDARGPNRVLHVIRGGDYGYRSRFGGSGLHPFDAWNGELPGTLPMVAGVGEAPVGLVPCKGTSLPESYDEDYLVCVWGTNQVVRVRSRARWSSLQGDAEPLITGNESFRPTGMTATSDGTIYIADWADRRYPVHGKGRLWRLSAKPNPSKQPPRSSFAAHVKGAQRLTRVARTRSFADLVVAATDHDPFVVSTATGELGHMRFRESVSKLLADQDSRRRMVALLTLRMAGVRLEPERLISLLHDDDPSIRRMTMIWLGEQTRVDMAVHLQESMPLQTQTPELFETFMAASQLVTEEERRRVQEKTPGNRIDRSFDQRLLLQVVTDPDQAPTTVAMAARYINDLKKPGVIEALARLARSDTPPAAREAIRSLAAADDNRAHEILRTVALDRSRPSAIRADAVASLARSDPKAIELLTSMAASADQEVALAVARALTPEATHPPVRKQFEAVLRRADAAEPVTQQIRFARKESVDPRPASDDQWVEATRGGDVDAGRRVFFDPRAACSKCHRVDGRGGVIGPDLSNLRSSKNRRQILMSILHPSQNRSPDYQGYAVVMTDGKIHLGTQFHFRGESADLLKIDGNWIRFRLEDTEEYRALDVSLMPEDLADALSVEEIRDVVAFLSTEY